MTKQTFCKHGNPTYITLHAGDVFIDESYGSGRDQIIQKVAMPVCDQCLIEALGLARGGETSTQAKEG